MVKRLPTMMSGSGQIHLCLLAIQLSFLPNVMCLSLFPVFYACWVTSVVSDFVRHYEL